MNRKPAYKKPPAIRELERLANDEARRKHPDMPFLAPRRYRDDTANGLMKCILDFLKLKGHQAERISCTGRYVDNSKVVSDVTDAKRRIGSKKWIPTSMQRGTADISAIINGYSVKIEVKIGKDFQSEAQKQYQQQVKKAGGIYLITSNFEVFLDAYKQIININN